MKWQDIVFSVGNIAFSIALLPSVFSDNKPALFTSLLTAFFLTCYVFCYISLRMRFSAFFGAISAGLWWVLALQIWK